MSYRIIFTPEAEEQLAALYNYIAKAASPDIAERYTELVSIIGVFYGGQDYETIMQEGDSDNGISGH